MQLVFFCLLQQQSTPSAFSSPSNLQARHHAPPLTPTILFSTTSESEVREEPTIRNLKSLFKDHSDDEEGNELTTEQLRQLRREIIATRRRRQNEIEDSRRDRQDYLFIILGLVPCLLAFISWEELHVHFRNG